jgi:hypothetical protein
MNTCGKPTASLEDHTVHVRFTQDGKPVVGGVIFNVLEVSGNNLSSLKPVGWEVKLAGKYDEESKVLRVDCERDLGFWLDVHIGDPVCSCIAVGDPKHAWGCPNDSDAEVSSSDSESDEGGGGEGEESNDETPAKKAKIWHVQGPVAVPVDADTSDDDAVATAPRQVEYVDHGPCYPKGVLQRPHPGEYNNIYSTCNLEFEHSEEGTLREVLDDECGHTYGVYQGGGFDAGWTWNTKPHEVYIDSALWKDLSQGQKNIITDRAGIACPTCGMTNQVFVTDVFDKAWASD